MGDVYKAMNRSKRDGLHQSNSADSSLSQDGIPHDPSVDAQNKGLPYDRVDAVALHNDLSAAPVSRRPDDAAAQTSDMTHPATPPVAEAPTDRQAPDAKFATAIPTTDPSVNGYSQEVVVHHDRGSIITEQYRSIRLQILTRSRTRNLQTHMITSSVPLEGKTITSLNLGVTFSELPNHRTLLLEGDLRRPCFCNHFNRECTLGLAHLLRGEAPDLDSVIYHTVYENLDFLPAGERCAGSTEMLASPRMAEILEKLKGRYDHILIDTPPVINVTDACIIGAMSDETLMVIRLNKTPVQVVDRAKRLLRASNCEIAGAILTHQHQHVPGYLYKYYYA